MSDPLPWRSGSRQLAKYTYDLLELPSLMTGGAGRRPSYVANSDTLVGL